MMIMYDEQERIWKWSWPRETMKYFNQDNNVLAEI